MNFRGQAAIDLLLALILALVAVGSFSAVVTTYTDVQKQMGVHQQLTENALLTRTFVTHASFMYHVPLNYPIFGVGLPQAISDISRFNASIPVSPVRAFQHAQGVDCLVEVDWANKEVVVRVEGSDVGLTSDVTSVFPFEYPVGFEAEHDFGESDCFSPISLEGMN